MEASAFLSVDRAKSLCDQSHIGHNRWHPEIEPKVEVEPGQVVGMETLDAFDGQIKPDTTNEAVGRLNLGLVHPLTGPVYVKGAEPGDILEVTVRQIDPQPFGYTLQFRASASCEICFQTLTSFVGTLLAEQQLQRTYRVLAFQVLRSWE